MKQRKVTWEYPDEAPSDGPPASGETETTESLLGDLDGALPAGGEIPPSPGQPTCHLISSGEWWAGLNSEEFLKGILQRVSGCYDFRRRFEDEGQSNLSFTSSFGGKFVETLEELRVGDSTPPPTAPACSAVDPPPAETKSTTGPRPTRRRSRWKRLGLALGLLIVGVTVLWAVISATVNETTAEASPSPPPPPSSPSPPPPPSPFNPLIQCVYFGRC